MSSVLQSWVMNLPIRMQSTLVLGLRGPDTHRASEIKKITRWLRGITFRPGNPANVAEFMGTMPDRIAEKGPCARELEFCTQHYYSHLMHALEVVAYEHSDDIYVGLRAYELFADMCSLFHLEVETREHFRKRLGTIDWPEGQPDTFDEAMGQISRKQMP